MKRLKGLFFYLYLSGPQSRTGLKALNQTVALPYFAIHHSDLPVESLCFKMFFGPVIQVAL
ncbi:MAG: hypothetical protein EA411_07840 [Saprospirales bacterium]|nr:MAG: hypothetical protein EA411_07840 [Saprospirales bacterium]